MSVAIEFENISKQYQLGLVSTRTLSHDLNRWWKINVLRKEDPYLKIGEINVQSIKGNSEYVWALKDINLDIQQGDVVGIIGKNGAGKSTLLKILSKVTSPTTGTIKARGKIASLLEVGTGFHSELTGRENIYMNGSIMGMSKREIKSKLDEIVDFAGVERYLDTPVKRYSTGMIVRLGFAVAAHLEPDILIVDEVLAVGDVEFQKKAIGKMQDVSKGEGRTVLFVSHNMDSVQKLCNTGVVLKEGMIEYIGSVNHAIQVLQDVYSENKREWISDRKELKKGENIHFTRFALLRENKVLENDIITDNDEVDILIEYVIKDVIRSLSLGFELFDENGHCIYRSLNTDITPEINLKQKPGLNRLKATLNTRFLKTGKYKVVLSASYYNVAWICNPRGEASKVLTFTIDQSPIFSPMLITNDVLTNPRITWELT